MVQEVKLTEQELALMPEKARADDAVSLYLQNDYLTAYALHTAQRIERTGYKAAVGGGDNWDSHGELQRDFLISQGMTPSHHLLEIGCGTGRLARKAAPYLAVGNYTGIDISVDARGVALALAAAEGWITKKPMVTGGIPADMTADYVWAFSVCNHLPEPIMQSVIRAAAGAMHVGSRFYWSYKPRWNASRPGVKTFYHTENAYRRAANRAGLTFLDVPEWNDGTSHRLALSVLA